MNKFFTVFVLIFSNHHFCRPILRSDYSHVARLHNIKPILRLCLRMKEMWTPGADKEFRGKFSSTDQGEEGAQWSGALGPNYCYSHHDEGLCFDRYGTRGRSQIISLQEQKEETQALPRVLLNLFTRTQTPRIKSRSQS